MRDIELTHVADTGAVPPELVDSAYVAAPPGGVLSTTTLTDPSYGDTKAYTKPSLGGEFAPVRSALLGAPADGGKAKLDAVAVITVTAPIVPTPPVVWPGRASNNTSFNNLYPWHKTPPQGLDQNNPNPPPGLELAAEKTMPAPTAAMGVPVSQPVAKPKKEK